MYTACGSGRRRWLPRQSRDSLFLCIQRTDQNCFRARSASVRRIKRNRYAADRIQDRRAGTEEFSVTAGDTVDIMGPLGNGFRWRKQQRERLPSNRRRNRVPPMLDWRSSYTAKREVILGYRDSPVLNENSPHTGKWFLRQRTEGPEQRAMS